MLSQDEIDNLLSSLSVGIDEPSAGGPAGAPDAGGGTATASQQSSGEDEASIYEKRNYKLYNFRRPDKFSKDHLRALQTIHENFARQLGLVLTAYLRTTCEIDVVSVDQLTYDEFIRSMPSPMTVSILELEPLPGQILLGLGYDMTSSIIDRMLGGPGMAETKARELTDIEQSLIKRVIDRSSITLEDAWRSMMNVNVIQVGFEESYALIQVATPGEIVSLITFEMNLSNKDSGLMSLCIPYPVLEGVIGQLSAQRIFHGTGGADISQDHKDEVLGKLHYAKLPLQVYLGGTDISVKELLELGVGDVIQMDRNANDQLLVSVNERPKFYCRPGTVKNKVAVYITEAIEEEEAIEGFGIDDE